jgi:hypothetical protein
LQDGGLENRKKIWEDAEVDIEVAGDRRGRIAEALNADFRSQRHSDEFLRHTVFGVFQRHRRFSEVAPVNRGPIALLTRCDNLRASSAPTFA